MATKPDNSISQNPDEGWKTLPDESDAIQRLLRDASADRLEIKRMPSGQFQVRKLAHPQAYQAKRPSRAPKSPILGAAHEIVSELYGLGLVEPQTMREFDEACLTPVAKSLSPEELKTLRLRERASQAVFARHLNVATSTVSQWERGERQPEGAALKLLALIQAHGLSYFG